MKVRILDGEARDRLVIYIRRRMEEFGITPQALADSIQHDLDHPPLYRDANGNEWNGLGVQPNWLRAAQNAGVDPAFFRIEHSPARKSDTTGVNSSRTDPRQLHLFI